MPPPQPPLGVTVPDMAEWISAFFTSLQAGGQEHEGDTGEEELDEEEADTEEVFNLGEVWPGEERSMQKTFVYSEMGGMPR